ncbi:MAG: GNAT family N-acetyltransferase [Thermomicrobiales bacterium]
MVMQGEVVIARLAADEVGEYLSELVGALREAVEDGASVGFLPPLGVDEARGYWGRGDRGAAGGGRGARGADGAVLGTVQLDLAMRANGRHRAEVSRLIVRRAAQRRGVARALMAALEDEARRIGRTTLVLDTRQGDPSERLYQSLGWQVVGAIPQYARSADGSLAGTVLYYKLLP